MDSTHVTTRAEKLLAAAYPKMLECIAEDLKREQNTKRNFEFNISDNGDCKLFIGNGYTVTLK